MVDGLQDGLDGNFAVHGRRTRRIVGRIIGPRIVRLRAGVAAVVTAAASAAAGGKEQRQGKGRKKS